MSKPFVHIQNLSVQYGQKTVLKDLEWTYSTGSQWAIGGKSGSGKSTLAKAIAGQVSYQGSIDLNTPERKVLYVPSWYQFTNLEGDRNFYYQQRYNTQQRKDTQTVKSDLANFAKDANLLLEDSLPLIEALGLTDQLDAQLIELSSGEHKKMQLVKAFWQRPAMLVIDEPYTGLDKAARSALNDCFNDLSEKGTHLILLTNDTNLPQCINAFAVIENGQLKQVESPLHFIQAEVREAKNLPEFLKIEPTLSSSEIVRLKDVNVRYGDKTVLSDISWQIDRGERWVVQGHNGSGKSTLLSLINADHPQAYGYDIRLFGNQRGSGESIWDIKQKIGLISPEMHWYFDQTATVWETVASGLRDSIGLFSDISYREKQQVNELLDFFELTEVKNDLLQTLALGKQRLAMLARTIIKNPPLLVLDEPCQGLDQSQTQYFNDVVDELCQYGKTLLYVGHYESQLPKSIDHRLLLEKGHIVFNGAIRSVKETTVEQEA